ncbi:MAG: cytochrome c maturation protein CcmE [Candidatus Eisenbacteria bacterium]
MVEEGDRATSSFRSRMTDGQNALPVSYRGVVPDTFGEKGEVVVEGKLTQAGTPRPTSSWRSAPRSTR